MNPELLAPARDYICGKAAVDSGADAVYIAGPAFGAREAAGNTIQEVERLVQYGQRYNVKTYLTLNTLLYSHEFETARRLAFEAWEAGCAALIIQDPRLLEAELPPIPLFASTQMDNRTVEQILRLEQTGFKRVILARELSLPQIAAIRSASSIDLEFFVHGALCVCYSGRCYLSEQLTGKSANRGACVQACRNRYDLIDAEGQVLVKDKHLLSLHDLRLDSFLGDLAQAGISSFKIEGRLKNVSYIKNCVAHYRKKIDQLMLGKTSLGRVELGFIPDPERSFSRGYTSYYVDGKRSSWGTLHYGKARGEEIGSIQSQGHRFIASLFPDKELHSGDGICYADDWGKLTGSMVNGVRPLIKDQEKQAFALQLQSAQKVSSQRVLYRNYDHFFEKALAHPDAVKRVIDANLSIRIIDGVLKCSAQIPDGIGIDLEFFGNGMPALQAALANERIRKQLEKSAEDLYLFHVTALYNDPAWFFPAAQLNEWRRSIGRALLQTQLAAARSAANTSLAGPTYSAQKKELVEALIDLTLLPETIPEHVMHCKYCVKYQLDLCPKQAKAASQRGAGAVAEPLYLVNQGRRLLLHFDCSACEMFVSLEKNSVTHRP